MLQCVSENSRRICLTRCHSTGSNANNSAGQNQMEGHEPENPLLENDKKKSPPLTREARFRFEFLRRIVPWEKINDSWDTFPYSINECDKNILMECTASPLKHKKPTRDCGGRLASSSWRILLRTIPGAGLYREKMVRALAKEFQVPLMVLDDSSVAPPYVSLEFHFPPKSKPLDLLLRLNCSIFKRLFSLIFTNFQESNEELDEEDSLEPDFDDEDRSSDEEKSDDSDDEDDSNAVN